MSYYDEAVIENGELVQNVNLIDAIVFESVYNPKVKQFMYQGIPLYKNGTNKHPKIRTSQLLTTVEYIIENFRNIVRDENDFIVSSELENEFSDVTQMDTPKIYVEFKNGEVLNVTVKNIESNFQYHTILFGLRNMIEENTQNIIVNAAIQRLVFALQGAAMGVPMEKKTESGIIMPS